MIMPISQRLSQRNQCFQLVSFVTMKYEFGNTDTDTTVFCNTNTEYRTDFQKYRKKYRLPISTENTDTDPAQLLSLCFALSVQLLMHVNLALL